MFNFLQSNVPGITAEQVKKALDAKLDFVLLDVRTTEEFANGHIAGSVHVPIEHITQKIQNVLPDKNKLIYTYCLSGSRSTQAVKEMMKLGYSNVYSMTSGLLAWRTNGYPTSTKI